MYVYPNTEEQIAQYTDDIVNATGTRLLQMYRLDDSEDALEFADFVLSYAGRSDEPGRILDIGCGACGFLNAVQAKARHKPKRLCGINYHPCQLKYANPGIETHVGDAQALPFESDSFDLVTIMYTLGHMPDPGKALKEARRVLSPKGQLFYWDIVRTDANVSEHLGYQLFRKYDVVRWMEEAGFDVGEYPVYRPRFTKMFKRITSKEERRICRRVAQPVVLVGTPNG